MENLEQCPCCLSNDISTHGELKDYYVSQETFQTCKCNNCGFVFTNPRPDINEIGKYYQSEQYMSHNSNSTSIFHKIYRVIRNYMYNKKLSRISKHLAKNMQSISLMDYGAASGDFLGYCASNGMKELSGVEPDAVCRRIALEQHGVFLKSVEELAAFEMQSFDVITLWHVLEHIHNLDETIQTFHKLLNENGRLVISVPNVNSFDREIYKEYWSAYDVPRHLYHFNVETISILMKRLGFELSGKYSLPFDAYYISLHSEWYMKTPKFRAMFNAVKNGFRSNWSAGKTGNYSSVMYVFEKKDKFIL